MGRRRKSKKWWAPMFTNGRAPRTIAGEYTKGVGKGVGDVGTGLWRTLIVLRRIFR